MNALRKNLSFYFLRAVFLMLTLHVTQTLFAANWDSSGFVSAEGHSYFNSLNPPTRDWDSIFQMEASLKYKLSQDLFLVQLRQRSNTSSEVNNEQSFTMVKEAYWQSSNYPWVSTIGFQSFNWSLMDGFSPIDQINSKVYLDPLNPVRLGSPAAQLKYETDEWSVEAFYIVKQPRTILPAEDSRWLPRSILFDTSTAGQTFLLPETLRYQYNNPIELNSARDHNFGIRLQYQWDEIQLSASFFEGNNPLPQFLITASSTPNMTLPNTIDLDPDVILTPVYYKNRLYAAQMSWDLAEALLKLESVQFETLSSDPNIPAWTHQTALGVERPFRLLGTDATLIMQAYYGDSDIDKDNLISSSTRIFDETALAALRLSFSTSTSLTISYTQDFSTESSIGNFIFTTRFFGGSQLQIRGDFFDGDEQSLLGSYNENHRIITQLSYYW